MPKHFVSLCALPKTALLQSFCVAEYLDELTSKKETGDVTITNPASNMYTLTVESVYKRSLVWKLEAKFQVIEFDEPTLVLTEITIASDDDASTVMHILFKYNQNPKTLRYEWGQFIDIEEKLVKDDSYYMLLLAALKDNWIHRCVFERATRRVIQVRRNHVNIKPSTIPDVQPILDAIQEKIDIRVAST